MPRRPNPLLPEDGPRARFALELRELRDSRGAAAPSIDQISIQQRVPRSTLYAALRGDRVPTRDILAIIVNAWGGDEAAWMAKRSATEGELERNRRAAELAGQRAARLQLSSGEGDSADDSAWNRVKAAEILASSGDGHGMAAAVLAPISDGGPYDDRRQLVNLLRRARAEAGQPTLRRLAMLTHVPVSTLSDTFSGKRLPRYQTLDQLLRALGIDTAFQAQVMQTLDRALDQERRARDQRRLRSSGPA
jgi:transcriptional regulator with XRE-family HTH domain